MPITQEQLLRGATYQFETFAEGDPVDNIGQDRPFLKWLMTGKKPSVFSNGIFNEKVRIAYDSNYQNFTGDDELTFNTRDTVRKAPYQHYECFDGFSLNETELADNGIIITTDDKDVEPTREEASMIVDKLKEGWTVLKEGKQEKLDQELHLDGTANAKACPGLDLLVSTTPNTGVIAGLDAAIVTPWRNFADMGISVATPGNLIDRMEIGWRYTITRGKKGSPDFIPVGSSFYDALRRDARAVNDLNIMTPQRGGVVIDVSTKALYFNGVQVVWDPTFDALDDLLGPITYPWRKRGYFLNSRSIRLRPFKGRWMMKRIPERVYNRHTHYFGMSSDYGMTMDQRNANAVFSIA